MRNCRQVNGHNGVFFSQKSYVSKMLKEGDTPDPGLLLTSI